MPSTIRRGPSGRVIEVLEVGDTELVPPGLVLGAVIFWDGNNAYIAPMVVPPAIGEVLTWDGNEWLAMPAGGGGAPSGPAGNGLSGVYPNPGVVGMTAGALTNDGAHGNRGGGSLHPFAIASGAAGFMSGVDKAKLDGIAAGATDDHDSLSNVSADDHHNESHGFAGTEHTNSTLAQVNAKITDATLDTNTASRPPSGTATGGLGGSYPGPSVDGMSGGVLANDAAHGTRGGGTQHAVAVASGAAGFFSGTDKAKLDGIAAGATDDHDSLSNVSADDHHNESHAFAGAEHTNSTLAQVNSKITDATLDTNTASRPPSGTATGGLGGSYPGPSVDGMSGGVLANDSAHGTRGGGTQHSDAVPAGASGFLTGADKTKLDALILSSVYANLTSGLLAGGALSAGAGAGQGTIADGNGAVSSYADPNAPALSAFSWAGLTNFALVNIATTQSTYILVTPAGAVLQVSGSRPSKEQFRANVFLGWFNHPDNTNVSQVINAPQLAYNASQDWKTVLRTLDPIFLSDVVVTGNVGTLTMAVGAFEFWSEGTSFQASPNTPSDGAFAGADPLTFSTIYSDGTSGGDTNFQTASTTALDPSRIDNSGTLNVIAGSPNQATIQRLYVDPSGNPFWAYGQLLLPSLTEAVALAGNEPFVQSALMQSSHLIGRWCVIAGAVDLDAPAEQLYIANKGVGGGGAGVSAVTSVYGRAGIVTAQPGDTTSSEVTNDSTVSGAFVDDALNTLQSALSTANTKMLGAADLDEPNNADWIVAAIASIGSDSVDTMIVNRRFDDTTVQGVGFDLPIPAGATSMVLGIIGRAQAAPGGAVGVAPQLYTRQISDNVAVPAWSAALTLTTLDIPTNVFWQYDTQTITLATLGITAGRNAFFEFVRNGGLGGDTLSGNWNLYALTVRFV